MSSAERRKVSGSVQTAANGSSVQTIMKDWTNAHNRVAVVDLTIEAHGVTTGDTNAYHRRQAYFLGFNRTLARSLGILLAAPEEVEQNASCDAVVSLSGDKDLILTLTGASGAGAEAFDWSWNGHVTIFTIPWENPYNLLGDLSTNKFQGTMTNMESGDVSADSPGAGATYSTNFGGVDEFVTMGNVLDFARTEPFSISAWFKTVSAAAGFLVAKEIAGIPTGYDFYVSATGRISCGLINTYPTKWIQKYTDAVGYNDGAWHHAVVTWDGDVAGGAVGVKFYVDGALAASSIGADTLAANSINNGASLNIGRRQSTGDYFVGRMCHVSIFNKELSLAEAQAIYNAGDPPDLLKLATAANLVYWNRMRGLSLSAATRGSTEGEGSWKSSCFRRPSSSASRSGS